MSPASYGQHTEQREDLRNIDGEERVPFLSQAHMIAIAPGTPQEDHLEGPTYVFIEWAPGIVERPYPGSAIWRAVLERSLDHLDEQSRNQSDRQAREDSECHLRGVVDTDISDSADVKLRPHNYFRSDIEADLARFQSLEMWFRWRDHDRVVPGPR